MNLEVTNGIRHHPYSQCRGGHCPFHRPSDHPMVNAPMQLRETGLIERVCRHGIGHPDPDSAAFFDAAYRDPIGSWAVHGCDGCCLRPPPKPESLRPVGELQRELVELLKDLDGSP